MIEQGRARECDMVAAFLRAEISSPRYFQYIQLSLEQNGLTRDVIDSPDLENEFHNEIRRMLLQYRGYGMNSGLFTGFPSNVVWRFVEIEPQDHCMLFCMNDMTSESWVETSGGTRSIERIASRIARLEEAGSTAERQTAARVRSIQKDLDRGKVMPPLIAVDGENGRLILVEGHSRATAYVDLKWQRNISIVLGRSMTMNSWKYY